ncbi:unnamed protein product [Camellia sinensis]
MEPSGFRITGMKVKGFLVESVASIARECGNSWNDTPISVLIPMSAGFLDAGTLSGEGLESRCVLLAEGTEALVDEAENWSVGHVRRFGGFAWAR